MVEYGRYRYGDEIGASDGLVCWRDAFLPGAALVLVGDMDHVSLQCGSDSALERNILSTFRLAFVCMCEQMGPCWPHLPATDNYNKTHLALSLITMALELP